MDANNQAQRETICGELTTVTFRNEESGYSILKINVRGQRDPVTVVGVSQAQIGETVTAEGAWKSHPTYGRQFDAQSITTERPSSPTAIERYLASGAIKGIGPATAQRIVAEFGAQTFAVFDAEPERIAKVKGVGRGRAEAIIEAWKASQAERDLLVFLAGYNIMGALAHRIIKRYQGATVEVVEQRPYRLAAEVRGIGFQTADGIAQAVGIARDNPERIAAGLRHVVSTSNGMGHCGIGFADFLRASCELLGLAEGVIRPILDGELQRQKFMVAIRMDGADYVFDKRLYDAEVAIANALGQMRAVPPWTLPADRVDAIVERAEKACGVDLAPEQRDAVRMVLTCGCSILTGGPGTGKTSTLKVILEALRAVNARVILGAPTGKAAKRMKEATGLQASTVARLVGMGMGPDAPPAIIDCSILVVDESSMLDVLLMQSVARCLVEGAALLFVGDVDQLPSVGPGRVLGDLIDSGAIPTTRLTQVFRQAASSAIIRNAHRINKGVSIEPQPAGGSDFYFIEANDPEAVCERITSMVMRHIPDRIGIAPHDVQVLSPMRKGATGTEALNARLQSCLNPSPAAFVSRFGKRYGVGDRILQTVNNYDLGVMNGESGIIVNIDAAAEKMSVDVDGTVVEYPYADLDQIDLAYAMTVHKSQGSQFPAVVIPVTTQHYMMLQRAIIYTGITRASQFCVLVGQRKALEMAIANNRVEPRITVLQPLMEFYGAPADVAGLPNPFE